jgi:Fur family zinc uptake transcriptional regulator
VAWTPLRDTVFRVLADAAGPVSAYDVTDGVSARTGRRVAANSVYRILDLFVANDLAKRVESMNAFVANTHPACAHDCIWLLCDSCGAASHLDDDAVASTLRARASETGFRPVRPVMEVRGLCATCGGES